jgi:gamma-glutamylcyclotransferase (GGCT)/AIG2-like uncharacterized protein YtfP
MYLFVYGTLRFSNSLIKEGALKDEFEFVGRGKIKALMYDIGSYPGAVKDNSGNEVNGEIFRELNKKRAFDILDAYENYDRTDEGHCEYIRRRTRIRMNSGEFLMAWVYWYNGDLKTKNRIVENDYLEYLAIKARELRHM